MTTDGSPAAGEEFRAGQGALRNLQRLGIDPQRAGPLRMNATHATLLDDTDDTAGGAGSQSDRRSDTTMTNESNDDATEENSEENDDAETFDGDDVRATIAGEWYDAITEVLEENEIDPPAGAVGVAVNDAVEEHVSGDPADLVEERRAALDAAVETLVSEYDVRPGGSGDRSESDQQSDLRSDDGDESGEGEAEATTANASPVTGAQSRGFIEGRSNGERVEADRPGAAYDSASAPAAENADRVQGDRVYDRIGDASASDRSRSGEGFAAYKAAQDAYSGEHFTWERYLRDRGDPTPTDPSAEDPSAEYVAGSAAPRSRGDRDGDGVTTNAMAAVPGRFDRSAKINAAQESGGEDASEYPSGGFSAWKRNAGDPLGAVGYTAWKAGGGERQSADPDQRWNP